MIIATVIAAAAIGAVWMALRWARRAARKAEARPVYIAAPFAAGDGLTVSDNVRRAVLLGMRYKRRGYRVVCVHPDILAGRYGDDSDPAQREAGMVRTLALCEEVARSGGRLAVLQRPSGGLSSGTARELELFLSIAPYSKVDVWRWQGNRPRRVRLDNVEHP